MSAAAAPPGRAAGWGRWSAAFLPGTPALVPELTGDTGRADLDELRAACTRAVTRMLNESPGIVVCVGVGTVTRRHDPSAWGTLAGFGVDVATAPRGRAVHDAPTLPLSLTLARLMLAAAHWSGEVLLQEVGPAATRDECRRLAGELPGSGSGWVVMADGSTARTARAPGGLDPRASDFDAGVEAALRAGDPDALTQIDPGLAAALGASGWGPWQVLAQVAAPARVEATVDYAQAPLGVGYVAGSWRADLASSSGG